MLHLPRTPCGTVIPTRKSLRRLQGKLLRNEKILIYNKVSQKQRKGCSALPFFARSAGIFAQRTQHES